jgi:hypothetical protein
MSGCDHETSAAADQPERLTFAPVASDRVDAFVHDDVDLAPASDLETASELREPLFRYERNGEATQPTGRGPQSP